MAQELEPLNLKITGNANGLSAELGKSQRDIAGFSSSIQSKLAGLSATPVTAIAAAGFAALTAGAASAAVAISKIKTQLDSIDESVKAADKIAISFKELQGLRLAIGESAGLDNEAIDKSLQKFQLNLAEAAQSGAGSVYDALARVGLSAGELLQAGPVEALKKIADATAGIKEPTDQLLLAYELFGKQGVGIVTTLRAGRDAIEESFNFGSKWLGLTEEQVRLVEAANDSWGRVEVVVGGIVQLFSAELAPIFLAITDYITESADGLDGLSEGAREFSDNLAYALGVAKDLYELSTVVGRTLYSIATLDFGSIPGKLGEALSFDSGDAFLAKVEEQRKKIAESISARKQELSLQDSAFIEGLEESTRAIDANAKALEKWKGLATPEEKYKAKLEELSQAVIKGGLDFEFFRRGVRAAYEELERFNQQQIESNRPKFATKGSKEAREILDKRAFDAKVNSQVESEVERLKRKIEEQKSNKPVDEMKTVLAAKLDNVANKLEEQKSNKPVDEMKTVLAAKLDNVANKLDGVISAVNNNKPVVRTANI